MGQLHNKNIILGVTGGIAAYKSADLLRRLQDKGATVRVVMSRGATEFITPLTMQALSGKPVHLDLLDSAAEAAMGHIELARWADLVLVAPATADFIARFASGRADDLLTTLCLASSAPVLLAPAMNQGMWRDAATSANMATLASRQVRVVGPADGSQACGDIGPGRMEEPTTIADYAASLFSPGSLDGRRVVVTAGPTREALDPVRYLSNHSSGKMGFALAAAAAEAGAKTTLICGPVNLPTPPGVVRVDVVSALDMLGAAENMAANCDIFIAAAAVADYRAATAEEHKIKKAGETMTIAMVRNPDIVATIAAGNPAPFTVGFAAETRDVRAYALGKMKDKGLDMIVSNDVSVPGIGFNSDENAATIHWCGSEIEIERTSKSKLARQIIEVIAAHAG